MGNQIRTTILLGIMTVLIILVGKMIGGQTGMVFALLLAAGMNFFSYFYSDRIVLRMYDAREVTPESAPELFEMVTALSGQANLPMPRVYIIPSETPNAFATGRDPEHAVVAVTQGILQLLNEDEIKGVIAHELAHVKNRDILIGSIAATMAGAIMIIASMARWSAIFGGSSQDEEEGGTGGVIGLILMSIIAPLAATIIQMAVSRSREYLADATGAAFAGSPRGLASALEKLDAYSRRIPMDVNPSTAHMFIVSPLFSMKSFSSLFSTHPPIDHRIDRLIGRAPRQSPKEEHSNHGKDFWDRLS